MSKYGTFNVNNIDYHLINGSGEPLNMQWIALCLDKKTTLGTILIYDQSWVKLVISYNVLK